MVLSSVVCSVVRWQHPGAHGGATAVRAARGPLQCRMRPSTNPWPRTSDHDPALLNQGADAGRYANDDIHAVRILVMEPTTDRNRGPKSGRLFRSHASERLRVLGEIPVRKFDKDGNYLASVDIRGENTTQQSEPWGLAVAPDGTW